jgi:hypothetical protein
MSRKGLTIPKVQHAMRRTSTILSDVNAVDKAVRTHSIAPISKRVERRLIWRYGTRFLRGLSK